MQSSRNLVWLYGTFLKSRNSAFRFCHSSFKERNSNEWDIVISGGGLVGSAMACALGQLRMMSEKRILLLEGSQARDFPPLTDKYSNRVTALNPNTKEFLTDLGVWQRMSSLRIKTVKKLQVWESCSNASIGFQHPTLREDVAYIVENDVILQSLNQKLKESPNVSVWHGFKVDSYKLPKTIHSHGISDDLVELSLQDGCHLKAQLLIGADGINSLVRRTMGCKYINWNYDQKAIVATLHLCEPTDNNVAWQRFMTTGPIALLPLTDSQSSLVWSTTPQMADQLMDMPEDTFVDVLNSALCQEKRNNPLVAAVTSTVQNVLTTVIPNYGSIKQIPPSILKIEPESRASFPLGLGHATNYVMAKVALIGDAAHRVHPLAGLGVNLGFGDAKCLADVINKSVMNGYKLGYLPSLYEYESERQRNNVPVMAAIDGLYRLYTTELLPVVLLRSVGLQLTDAFTPIKKQIINGASA